MDEAQYKQQKELMQVRHTKELNSLDLDYATEHNKISTGDTVSSGYGTIVVDKIDVAKSNIFSNIPCCIYSGRVLTKSMSLRKDGQTMTVWQHSVIRHLTTETGGYVPGDCKK